MESTATLNIRQRRQAMKNSKNSNNNRNNEQKSVQVIYSEPKMIMVGSYTTKSGQVKNRYRVNPNAKAIKIITHKVYHLNF